MSSVVKNMVKVGYEVATQKTFAIEYFHEGTAGQYADENKYEVVAIKYKDVTDPCDDYKDWLWLIEVYKI